jgi:hypothetical protein
MLSWTSGRDGALSAGSAPFFPPCPFVLTIAPRDVAPVIMLI